MIEGMFRRWPRLKEWAAIDSTMSSAAVLLVGSLGAHLVTIALMPVLTRVATPEEFGGVAAFISVIGLMLPIASLRYEWAIPMAVTPAQAAGLVRLSFVILAVLSVLLATVGIALNESAADSASGAQAMVHGWLIGPGLFVLGTVQILASWTIRVGNYKALAIARFVHSALVGLGQIGAAVFFGGASALAVALLAGQVCAYFIVLKPMLRDVQGARRDGDASSLLPVAKEFIRFPVYSAPSSLANSAGVEAPILLISQLAGVVAAGHLSLAQRIAALPGMMAAQSLGQTFYTEAARLARHDPEALRRLYRRTVGRLAVMGIPVVSVLLLAPWFFPLLFGDQWADSGWMAFWLTITCMAQIVLGTVSCLEYLNRQRLNLLWNVGRLAIVTAAIYLSISAGLSSISVVAAYSIASACWYPVLYFFNERSLAMAISSASQRRAE
jgi:O-antigen/teichoic acid export membrane protein